MADITKTDLQTYVKDLIANPIGADINIKKIPSDKRPFNTGEFQNGNRRPAGNHSLMKEYLEIWRALDEL